MKQIKSSLGQPAFNFPASILFLSIAVIFIVNAVIYFTGKYFDGRWMHEFGDFFGALNTLFSGLAFAGIFLTLRLQQRQLEKQEREFNLSSFESRFFQMLQAQREMTNELEFENLKGRKVLEYLYLGPFRTAYVANRLSEFALETDEDNMYVLQSEIEGKISTDEVIAAYDDFFVKYQSELSHYFRHLYHLVKIVPDSGLFDDDKEMYRYTKIIKAQLSTYETMLLFYNGLSIVRDKKRKFKDLLERFIMFKNIDEKLLVNGAAEKAAYDGHAFSAPDEE